MSKSYNNATIDSGDTTPSSSNFFRMITGELDLENNSFNGTLHAELGKLTELGKFSVFLRMLLVAVEAVYHASHLWWYTYLLKY